MCGADTASSPSFSSLVAYPSYTALDVGDSRCSAATPPPKGKCLPRQTRCSRGVIDLGLASIFTATASTPSYSKAPANSLSTSDPSYSEPANAQMPPLAAARRITSLMEGIWEVTDAYNRREHTVAAVTAADRKGSSGGTNGGSSASFPSTPSPQRELLVEVHEGMATPPLTGRTPKGSRLASVPMAVADVVGAAHAAAKQRAAEARRAREAAEYLAFEEEDRRRTEANAAIRKAEEEARATALKSAKNATNATSEEDGLPALNSSGASPSSLTDAASPIAVTKDEEGDSPSSSPQQGRRGPLRASIGGMIDAEPAPDEPDSPFGVAAAEAEAEARRNSMHSGGKSDHDQGDDEGRAAREAYEREVALRDADAAASFAEERRQRERLAADARAREAEWAAREAKAAKAAEARRLADTLGRGDDGDSADSETEAKEPQKLAKIADAAAPSANKSASVVPMAPAVAEGIATDDIKLLWSVVKTMQQQVSEFLFCKRGPIPTSTTPSASGQKEYFTPFCATEADRRRAHRMGERSLYYAGPSFYSKIRAEEKNDNKGGSPLAVNTADADEQYWLLGIDGVSYASHAVTSVLFFDSAADEADGDADDESGASAPVVAMDNAAIAAAIRSSVSATCGADTSAEPTHDDTSSQCSEGSTEGLVIAPPSHVPHVIEGGSYEFGTPSFDGTTPPDAGGLSVSPRAGRLLIFTSGAENSFHRKRVFATEEGKGGKHGGNGAVLRSLTTAFTCDKLVGVRIGSHFDPHEAAAAASASNSSLAAPSDLYRVLEAAIRHDPEAFAALQAGTAAAVKEEQRQTILREEAARKGPDPRPVVGNNRVFLRKPDEVDSEGEGDSEDVAETYGDDGEAEGIGLADEDVVLGGDDDDV